MSCRHRRETLGAIVLADDRCGNEFALQNITLLQTKNETLCGDAAIRVRQKLNLRSNGRHVEDASDPTRLSMVLVSQQVIYLVLDLIGQVFGAFQSGRTVATVILIGIESPKGGNQDCQDYDDCRPHDSSR
jgi:hypothetical protein